MEFKEFKKIVHPILFSEWDPWGLSDVSNNADDYEQALVALYPKRESEEHLFDELQKLEETVYQAGYDSKNINHVQNLKHIASSIFRATNK